MEKKTEHKGPIVKIMAFVCMVALLCAGWLSPVYGADYFETSRYDVDIKLAENYTFEVCETIDVEFSQPRHGLFRYIPYKGIITRTVDGKNVHDRYRMKISHVRVDGRPFQAVYANGELSIKIGKESEYVDGPQRYVIRYQCTVYENPNEEKGDEFFYWNILPHDWSTAIASGQFTIHMPKEFAAEKAEFIGGKYGDVDMEAVDWKVDGKVITGSLTRVMEEREGVTVNVPLAAGYFVGQKNLQWLIALLVLLVFAAGLSTLVLWLRYGKNKRIIKTVEFYPPEGMSSAEAAYQIDGIVNNKQLVSLLIYWANKGYLEIKEKRKPEKGFTLIKKRNLPDTSFPYELTMFRGLFLNGKEVGSEQLKRRFAPFFRSAKAQMKGKFIRKKENRVYTGASQVARIASWILMFLTLLLPPIISMFYRTNEGGVTIMLALLMIFIACLVFLQSIFMGINKLSEINRVRTVMMFSQGLLFFFYASLMALLAVDVFKNIFIAVPVVLSVLVSLLCGTYMKKRTEENHMFAGKLLGFRKFIKIAELDRIERLAEEDPTYFFDVLPYAYAFGLTDKWIKKFASIAIPSPSWYDGGKGSVFVPYTFIHTFTSDVQRNMTAISFPETVGSSGNSGSSGGGGGGGSDSSSGGGFSGGGMGGGGGGSW